MSLRKIAGLLIAGGLAVGLIGSGVGAQFSDSVTAQQNISVGTFACLITNENGTPIAPGVKSVTFTSPEVLSSVAGTAPFNFTVSNNGSIPQYVQITATPTAAIAAPFHLLGSLADVPVAAGHSHMYSTGLSWDELGNASQHAAFSIVYSVACVDHPTGSATVSIDGSGNPIYVTVTGDGFTSGNPIQITYAYDSWDSIDLGNYPSGWFNPPYPPSATPAGHFTETWQDDCADALGVVMHGNQAVVVTATDGVNHATGSGIMACP
jgi:predicted ribosomally synthesized peptide with SipW-like signal peptide